MNEMLLSYLTGVVGLVLLAVVVLVVFVRFRRFSAAADELRGGLTRGIEALPVVRGRRG